MVMDDAADEIARLKREIERQNTMILELTEEREIKNSQIAEFRERVAGLQAWHEAIVAALSTSKLGDE